MAAKGDSEAVREIVERHQAMVYGTCLRILGNQADAEDDQGRILVDVKHVATANAKGEFKTPEGKLLLRVKENGEVDPDLMGAPVKVTRDGTLTGAGESHSWVEGKFNIGDKRHMEITPKDSPSKQAATLMFIMASAVRVVAEPK